jgi:hypothetical protein
MGPSSTRDCCRAQLRDECRGGHPR